MSPKITICPHFLIEYTLTTPKEIYIEIIKPLYDCLNECKSKEIQVVLSKEILLAFHSSYPWDQTSDPIWAGHLRDWYHLISPGILKADIINVDSSVIGITSNCSLLQPPIINMFARFLTVFGSNTMHGGLNEEGIFLSQNCSFPIQLQNFCYVIHINDIAKVMHPWLRVYNQRLPYEGDYPFVPPANWRNSSSPIKGSLRGYLDHSGSSWEWDRMHGNHWDVQHSNTRDDYTNVSPEGRIL